MQGRSVGFIELSDSQEANYVSRGLQELVAYYSNRLSYEELQGLMVRMTGSAVLSHQGSWDLVQQNVQVLSDQRSEEFRPLMETERASVTISFSDEIDLYNKTADEILLFDDGILVKAQKQKREKPALEPVEARIGAGSEKARVNVLSDVVLLQIAANQFEYVFPPIYPDGTFRMSLEAVVLQRLYHHYGTWTKPLPLVVISDGASVIRKRLARMFGDGVTWVSMIPFAFKALKGRPVPAHQVRVLMGLSRLPDAEQEFGVQTMALWGMTETLSACIVTDADQPGPAGSIGRPSPFYGVEVRKRDGTIAGPGEEGLLYIRGERGVSLFKEYYQTPEKTEEAFDASGALDTGDIVRIDEQGWMFYVARDKDMLRVGGENVAALEIETAIDETGLVSECAVVAQKHYMLGDVPAAFVTLNDAGKALTEDDVTERILAHCRNQLADFKVPRSVHIIDDFPRSTLDRIAKKKLREQLPPIEED